MSIAEITMLYMFVSFGFSLTSFMSVPMKNLKHKWKLHMVIGNYRIHEIQILFSHFYNPMLILNLLFKSWITEIGETNVPEWDWTITNLTLKCICVAESSLVQG